MSRIKETAWSISKKAKDGANYAIGKELIVIEDVNSETDFRMAGKKDEWFCIRCTDGNLTQDIHLAAGGIKALAVKMPQDKQSWKGYAFMFKGVTGSGFDTKTDVDVLGKKGVQQGLDQPKDDKNPLVSDASGQLMRMVACSTSGINDTDFWKNVQAVTGGNLTGGMALVQHLKEKGELFQDKDGFWKVGK